MTHNNIHVERDKAMGCRIKNKALKDKDNFIGRFQVKFFFFKDFQVNTYEPNKAVVV